MLLLARSVLRRRERDEQGQDLLPQNEGDLPECPRPEPSSSRRLPLQHGSSIQAGYEATIGNYLRHSSTQDISRRSWP